MKINSYLIKEGQLFLDFQNWFSLFGVTISTEPILDADYWICLRPIEAEKSPDITRTIIQVHDCYDHDVEICSKAKCVIFTHPIQYYLWIKRGFTGNFKIIPIGSRKNVSPIDILPEKPTLGFFTRETKLLEKRTPLFKKLVLEAKKEYDFNVLLVGHSLKNIADIGIYEKRAALIQDYSRIDALFTSSISPAIPLSIYEALAAGKPVISTPRWFTFSSNLIFQESDEEKLKNTIIDVLKNREFFYENREKFKISPYILENWIEENIKTCYE
jgi:glycosyltransferase involved in cell wall biosynthesis